MTRREAIAKKVNDFNKMLQNLQMSRAYGIFKSGGSIEEKKELERYKHEQKKEIEEKKEFYKRILKNNELMHKSLIKVFK